jgi:UDP-N-acetylmuramoyl-tripeptide--D-alanyl-D-alanine ligase
MWMRGETRARIVTFGFDESNDVRASDFALDWPNGMRLTVHAGGERRLVRSRLIGKHMAYPILAAVAVGLAERFTLDEIIPRLELLSPTPGRLEPVALPNGAILLRDDYKSTLETIDAALDTFAQVPARRRIVVLGEVSEPQGNQGDIYRRLGGRLAEIASRVVFVGQERTWSPTSSGAKRRGMSREQLFKAGESAAKATHELSRDLGPGDVVLIKGRDTQRLDRIALALQGRTVRCAITFCRAPVRCANCPMLEREWNSATPGASKPDGSVLPLPI